MAPLEALALEYPLIDSNFRKFCASHGIFTVEDFLVHDLYALAAFAEQDCSSDELKQGITQVLSILDNQHRPWLNGLELLENAEQKKHLSTGCERIDVLLQGGLREGHVTELVGPSSSGKTQICLQAAANVAKKYAGMVVYLDSGNSFSPKRMAQFLSRSFNPANSEVNQILERVMSSIMHHSVFDMFTLLDLLHQLLHDFKSQICCQVRMVIIDSLSSLISPVLGGGGAHGHALMVSAGFLLKELAHEHNLSVVVSM
ncbi:DNA repair protein RAD51 homolog 4 isoform X6 [Henckelia pumila]|uniref:DNA repair protein RAD51 homolog 4 isoform X6 n=1 Tax=Henckelia pumila TaxID=405737 RepID=UPI003C6E9C81